MEPLKDNEFEYYLSLYFMLFCYMMVLICYLQSINIKNYTISRVILIK